MKLFSLVDQNVKESGYYDCAYRSFLNILWGKYHKGQLIVSLHGFNVKFNESGGNEFSWGMVRVLIKLAQNKQHFIMYVSFIYICVYPYLMYFVYTHT